MMIAVKLVGGLGNQLFQYAFGRTLAVRLRMPLRLVPGRDPNPHGRFELDRFRIEASVAGRLERSLLWEPLERVVDPVARRLRLPQRASWLRIVRQEGFRFDPALLETRSPAYLIGYWQSERYFQEAADSLRRELHLRGPLDDDAARQLKVIEGAPSVAVHVRRGDYILDPSTAAAYGICAPSYYEAARALLAERVGPLRFFFFSDDIDWTRRAFSHWSEAEFVSAPGGDRCQEFELMRSCRHFITANSTFSWWAAWLGSSLDKVVIAPAKWAAAAENVIDLVPSSWSRI